jgi:hypothetical protein
VVGMAVPIAEGSHDIRMEYRPFARGLYWPAAVWLELVLLAMIAVAVLARKRALSRPALSTARLPGAATPVAMPGGRFRELLGRARR